MTDNFSFRRGPRSATIVVALIASWLPARRAPAVDPARLRPPDFESLRLFDRHGVALGQGLSETDASATWTPIADGKIPVGSIGAIAVADSNPNVIYVATGSDGVRSNVSRSMPESLATLRVPLGKLLGVRS